VRVLRLIVPLSHF